MYNFAAGRFTQRNFVTDFIRLNYRLGVLAVTYALHLHVYVAR